MEEIKFKAWDNLEKKFINPESVVIRIDNIVVFDRETCEELYDIILLQYTGLKDKNDLEVYKGDVVKYHFCTHFLSLCLSQQVAPIPVTETNKLLLFHADS